MEEIKYAKSYKHVYVVSVSTPMLSNIEWEISHRYEYVKQFLSPTQELIFVGHFILKRKNFAIAHELRSTYVFICMSIKAVHLEIVSDLSSSGFLAALRRFAARRGVQAHIYSDNGTNFVGVNNQLKELYVLFNSDEHKDRIESFSSDHGIT